jgi:hypothetical protein
MPRTSIGSDGEGLREHIWLVNVTRTSKKYTEEELLIYRWDAEEEEVVMKLSFCSD